MILPFLPDREIELMFQHLQHQASEPLQPFIEHLSNTLIHGTPWGPSDWSVFKKVVRTDNNVKGVHNGLNHRASGCGQLPLYLLVQLLHGETQFTALQICLVSDTKLKRISAMSTVSCEQSCLTCGTSWKRSNSQSNTS